jgi:hypothetical protein
MEFKAPTDDLFRLGDIGDYKNAEDIIPIGSATIFAINAAAVLTRMGFVGGKSLNTYFDTFGLEGILANTSLIVILFQLTRFAYTKLYTEAGKAWSPFVFVCALIVMQILHDLFFYFGVINVVPSGNNEMVDAMKRYSVENGPRALASHAGFLILVAVVAMFLKERSLMFILMTSIFTLYLLPYVLTTFGPKPPPPPPPPAEKKAKPQETGAWGPLR